MHGCIFHRYFVPADSLICDKTKLPGAVQHKWLSELKSPPCWIENNEWELGLVRQTRSKLSWRKISGQQSVFEFNKETFYLFKAEEMSCFIFYVK